MHENALILRHLKIAIFSGDDTYGLPLIWERAQMEWQRGG